MRKITRTFLTLAVTAALLAGFAGVSFAAETKAKDAPKATQMGNTDCPGLKQGHMQGGMMKGGMMQGGSGCPMMGAGATPTKA